MTVFVVTCQMEGCYDCSNEYHVVGVFTSKEKAEALRKEHEKPKTTMHLHYNYCSIAEVIVQ